MVDNKGLDTEIVAVSRKEIFLSKELSELLIG